MNCADVMPLIPAYADGEVDGPQRHAIGRHLQRCAACAARHDELRALRERIRAEAPYHAAPAALRARLQTLVAPDARVTVTSNARDRWRSLFAGALAGCAATVLAWFVTTAVLDWREHEDIAQQAVAAHVRATLGAHLVDVASSDQHRVKPWLSARLDYSPPVQDLADEGFTLVGGRLDTLAQRPVATLVYRYREHVIDVFVRPATSQNASAPRMLRGFNVAYARGAGMDWTAVSDARAEVLSSFVARLAAQPNGATP